MPLLPFAVHMKRCLHKRRSWRGPILQVTRGHSLLIPHFLRPDDVTVVASFQRPVPQNQLLPHLFRLSDGKAYLSQSGVFFGFVPGFLGPDSVTRATSCSQAAPSSGIYRAHEFHVDGKSGFVNVLIPFLSSSRQVPSYPQTHHATPQTSP